MASAGPKRHKHWPGGGVLGLCMKPPIRSIGQCASRRINPAAWLSYQPGGMVVAFVVHCVIFFRS
jgi:hypothetical protein